MSNIKKWFEILSDNGIHAYNKVSNGDLSLCFNFLQIPNTTTIVMTVAVMKDKIMKGSLESENFRRIMNSIESALIEIYWDSDRTNVLPEHFVENRFKLRTQWYVQLRCHKIFFIPDDSLWKVISKLFSKNRITFMKSKGVNEVAVFVSTDNHDFNTKFY